MKRIALTLLMSLVTLPAFAGGVSMDNSKSTPMMSEPAPECGPWYVSIGGGTGFNVGGTVLNGFNGSIPNTPVRLNLPEANYNDIYDNSAIIRGEIGYAFRNRFEIFAKFEYETASGGSDSGLLTIPTGGAAALEGLPLPAPGPGGLVGVISRSFGDYERFGGELGLRYYFLPRESRLNFYVAGSAGAAEVSGIDAHADLTFTTGLGNLSFRVFDGPIYHDSIVFTGSGVIGAEYQLIRCASIGVNAGVSYQSGLDGDDSEINRAGLSYLRGLNDAGERWSVPVTVYTKIRF